MPCSVSTRQICSTGESHLVDVDVVDDQVSRRSSSAAAKNAEAVLRISFARRNSAFSRLSRLTSADSVVDSADKGLDPVSIQFRRVAGFMPSSDPTWVRAATLEHCASARCSWYIRTARSRVSASNFRGAALGSRLPLDRNPPDPGRFNAAVGVAGKSKLRRHGSDGRGSVVLEEPREAPSVNAPLAAGAEQEANRTTMVTTKVIDIVITDRFNDSPGRPNGERLIFCNGHVGHALALVSQPS